MFVGVAEVEMFFSYSGSLKEKRRALRKLIDNLKNNFPVSVSEVDMQDLWQKAVIGISTVSSDKVVIDRVFEKVEDFIERLNICEIITFRKEIFSW